MADRLEEFGRVTARAARELAVRQAEAAGRYAQVLRNFGKGEFSVTKCGAELISFSFNESLKYAETVAEVGSDYLRSAIIIVGGRVADTASQTEPAARVAPAGARTASTSKPAKRRARSARAAPAEAKAD